MSSGNQFNGNRQFATTQWSIVRAVSNENAEAADSALQELCQTYWYPLYTFVRRQGNDASAAADLTQAFFADLLQREDLKKVDPSLGKFRSFLLTALKQISGTRPKLRNAAVGNRRYRLISEKQTIDISLNHHTLRLLN
jgi:RNA polymerase sigma-70 factor (ECF subfamily)